jgi:hypothetical protein
MQFLKKLFQKKSPRFKKRDHAALLNDWARREILKQPRYQDPLRLLAKGRKIFSQGDEDGIIGEIFLRIGVSSKRFCEIGVGDGRQNNTLALLYQGWSGVWVEGSKRRCASICSTFSWAIKAGQLELVQKRIDADSAQMLAREIKDFFSLDLFSIDIDGIDWHVVKALPGLKARVVVVEYNVKFAPPIEFIVRNEPGFSWRRDDYFSASLSAWEKLMRDKGYALVGCGLTGANAYFVRADLANENLFCTPFTAENHYEPARYWLVSGWSSGHAASGSAPHKL